MYNTIPSSILPVSISWVADKYMMNMLLSLVPSQVLCTKLQVDLICRVLQGSVGNMRVVNMSSGSIKKQLDNVSSVHNLIPLPLNIF